VGLLSFILITPQPCPPKTPRTSTRSRARPTPPLLHTRTMGRPPVKGGDCLWARCPGFRVR